jgi:2-iminobutanoate/2-iminopropanoate deaminase
MIKKIISTEKAPKAIGPYSQAVVVNGILYSSGQIGLKSNGELVGEDIESQTRQVLENLKAILSEAGADLDSVIKTTIFLDSMEDFSVVNEIYGEYFSSNRPARSTVAVDTLPKSVKVEIDCIAKVIR